MFFKLIKIHRAHLDSLLMLDPINELFTFESHFIILSRFIQFTFISTIMRQSYLT